MDKRKDRRKKLEKVALINNEPCVVIEISPDGLRLSTDDIPTFPDISVTFQIGEKIIKLKGKIRWEGKKERFTRLRELGVAIVDAPTEFYQYYEKLPFITHFKSVADN